MLKTSSGDVRASLPSDAAFELSARTSSGNIASDFPSMHGDRNALHAPEEARSLFARYPGPKEMHWVPDAGHTEWMLDDHPKFVALAETLDRWLRSRISI